jgi:hypothetical protein
MIHWQKVLKPIRDAGQEGISRKDIAAKTGTEEGDSELEITLDYLRSNGKIRAALGPTEQGGVSLVYQISVPRRSRREDIKHDPEVDELFDPPEKTETVNQPETPQENVSPSHRLLNNDDTECSPRDTNDLKKEPL